MEQIVPIWSIKTEQTTSECGAARDDTQGSTIFSVRRKFVKVSADGGSLSISKDTGEVYKATGMIPKKRRPSIDEFGFRSAPGIRKSLSGLTSADTAKRQAEANVVGEGSSSTHHCTTRSDDGPISIYSQKRKNPDFDPLENV
jgi:hypothetical protein